MTQKVDTTLPAEAPLALDSTSQINRPMITLSIMLATTIMSIDSTIANVALPHMQGSLSATQDQIMWVLTSFIVATAIATPLTGWLSDRYGLKRIFIVSVAGFTIASVLCGLSGSITEMVIARILQGALGAALIPMSQAILFDINPVEKRGQAMSIWGIALIFGSLIGPTLGGWITDSYSWRWCFFINIPVGIFALWGGWRFVPDGGKRKVGRFDLFGFALLGLAIGALQLLLDRGQGNDWFSSIETWIEASVLVVCFVYFVIHTVTKPAGTTFFNYKLLFNSNYLAGLFFIFLVGVLLFSCRALTPTLLQNLLGYPALLSGWVMAPSGIGALCVILIMGKITGKVDDRILLAIGFGMAAVALWKMSQYSLQMTPFDVILPTTIQSMAMGLLIVPISTLAYASLALELRNDATAFFSLIRNIGGSVGISVVQTFLSRNTQVLHSSLMSNISIGNAAFGDPMVRAMYGAKNPLGASLLNAEVTRMAAMFAYVDDFWLLCIVTLISIPVVFLFRKHKVKASSGNEKNPHMTLE